MTIRRPIISVLIALLLLASCAPGSTIPLNQKPGQVTSYEGKNRIKMKDGSEYITNTFTLSDSLLVIKWLDPSDARFAKTIHPISLPVRDVSKVESLAKTPSKFGMVVLVGCAAAVVGLTFWIVGQFAD